MTPFVWPVRVYIEDTDAGGIVYYVNYLKYLERARSEWFRAMGYKKAAFPDNFSMFVVTEVSLKYLRPARLDDELQVSVELKSLGAAKLLFEQWIERDGERLCGGEITVACVDSDALRPQRIPPAIRESLKSWQ